MNVATEDHTFWLPYRTKEQRGRVEILAIPVQIRKVFSPERCQIVMEGSRMVQYRPCRRNFSASQILAERELHEVADSFSRQSNARREKHRVAVLRAHLEIHSGALCRSRDML